MQSEMQILRLYLVGQRWRTDTTGVSSTGVYIRKLTKSDGYIVEHPSAKCERVMNRDIGCGCVFCG